MVIIIYLLFDLWPVRRGCTFRPSSTGRTGISSWTIILHPLVVCNLLGVNVLGPLPWIVCTEKKIIANYSKRQVNVTKTRPSLFFISISWYSQCAYAKIKVTYFSNPCHLTRYSTSPCFIRLSTISSTFFVAELIVRFIFLAWWRNRELLGAATKIFWARLFFCNRKGNGSCRDRCLQYSRVPSLEDMWNCYRISIRISLTQITIGFVFSMMSRDSKRNALLLCCNHWNKDRGREAGMLMSFSQAVVVVVVRVRELNHGLRSRYRKSN